MLPSIRSHRRVPEGRTASRNGQPFGQARPVVRADANSTRDRASGSTNPSDDLRLQLWSGLIEVATSQLVKSVDGLRDSLDTGAVRLRRVLIEQPPAGFPPGPSGDQAVNLLGGPLSFLELTTRQHGSVVGLLLGGERVVLVADQEAARQVLVEQADTFIKQGTAFFPGSSLTGNGLLVSDGDIWRRQRRLSNPAFRKAAVDTYASAMVSATQDMLTGQWQTGGVRDVYADFNELTLRITLEALFGLPAPSAAAAHQGPVAIIPNASSSSGTDTAATAVAPAPVTVQAAVASSAAGSADAATIVAAVAKAFEFFTKRAGAGMVLPEWLPTWDNLEFGAAVAQLDRVVYGLINSRRRELAAAQGAGAAARTDLLQSLLTATDEDGSGMDDKSLRDELMTLLVAGQETSAILLGWACALLAHHPEVQAKAAREVSEQLQGRTPQASDVRSLRYIEAVVLEALRMYAPAYMVGRCACREAQLGQYRLPAGTTVLVSPYLLHRDPKVWGIDADEFRPERWEQWQSKEGYGGFMTLLSGLGPNGSYMPFGGGPRNCIGTGFAMMEAILVMAAVVQRFQLQPTPGAAFPSPKPLITLRPEGVPLRVVPR